MPQSVNIDDCDHDGEHMDNQTDENSVTDVVVNTKKYSVLEKGVAENTENFSCRPVRNRKLPSKYNELLCDDLNYCINYH